MGEIEMEGRVLVIRRIHVTYHLRLPAGNQEKAERAYAFHVENCPVARTIGGCVQITTTLKIEEIDEDEQ